MGRNYKKDTIQFLHISRGSAYEVETLLSVAQMIKIIDEENYIRLNEKLERNIQMLNGFIKYLEQKIIITVNRQRSTVNENAYCTRNIKKSTRARNKKQKTHPAPLYRRIPLCL